MTRNFNIFYIKSNRRNFFSLNITNFSVNLTDILVNSIDFSVNLTHFSVELTEKSCVKCSCLFYFLCYIFNNF